MTCLEKERLTRQLSEAIKELINARSIHGDTEPLSIEVLAVAQVYEDRLSTLLDHIRNHGCGATEQKIRLKQPSWLPSSAPPIYAFPTPSVGFPLYCDRCLLSRIMAVFRDPDQLRELETLRREYIIAMSETHDPAEKSRLSRMVEELNICIERLRREGDG
jgi:hypothetical protein